MVLTVLEAQRKAFKQGTYGPFILYVSRRWREAAQEKYQIGGGGVPITTTRHSIEWRVRQIDGITRIETASGLGNGMTIRLGEV